MNTDLLLTFTVLIVTTLFFMWGKLRSDVVALLSLLTLLLLGIITTEEALSGFSNSLVIMIAGLFVVGAGIFRTGLAEAAGKLTIKWGRGNPFLLLIMLMILVAVLSAFMSNTGTVAVLMPVIISVALKMNESPSKFLMPVAFASSLGGVLTLIGTPPNLIASQTLADYGYERLGFFDFTPIGLVALITGILFLVVFGKYLIPDRIALKDGQSSSTAPDELMKIYGVTEKIYRVSLPDEDSRLTGVKLKDLKLTNKYGIYILTIERKWRDKKTFQSKRIRKPAYANTVIKRGDTLFLEGEKEGIDSFTEDYGLLLYSHSEEDIHESLINAEIGLAELLLTPHSKFINERVSSLEFREKYGLNIVGMNRKGRYFFQEWADERLQFGDALLIQGEWKKIELIAKEYQDVVVVGQPGEQASKAKANGRAPLAGLIMLLMLLLMTFEITAPVTAVMLAAMAMVLTGCLRNMDEAYSRINWESVLLIGGMLPMATALEKTGGVEFLSNVMIDWLGSLGPLAVMTGFYFFTMLFSQFISNTATAVLFAPIAITTALQMSVSPYPFLIAVSVAASMAFATPVASPPNALVMTAGGYSFMDFVKAGVPLQIILFIVMMFTIPLFFPY
ncbi:SLC13 family permease [Salipaludibacillus sp. CUR1]|uniref:SLC13 family permease n=1 Tax=Salipaludibacillus sp. CUR1 TaxID=2820003 RepID=UPI001E4EB4A8|nr:SLC13 family permease [Salipaludibacillus sp. CUR1]MCE7792122.1 SLC13 family permease [Salipaludibacillus sp. CUR1]